ncbi:AzlD domain-containing protein [Yimella sp. NH-Cas1]|uniref:AzlD domain-containing protein n=1 Tax=Yimella sp. NH-Cas1 TaxID=2917726 RepID=UPI001EFBEF92|nr:AzlD domain-containing protein [Yimella sp. NH-Cas1]MCG8655727.1 AzlD domain-containing protein [Yimella sp. NH-Cas1]
MSLWAIVLVAGALSLVTKLLGYLVPHDWLGGPLISRIMKYLPIALLAALVAVQAFGGPQGSTIVDARAAGLLVAILALCLRAPFLLVIVLAGATAAILRAIGWG